MKKILIFPLLLLSSLSFAQSTQRVDLLIIGDSQIGATWGRTYFGNFLQECLAGNFLILGKGGSVLSHWLGSGGLDKNEIVQRDPENKHLNLGAGDAVPLFKKRLSPMLDTYNPQKVMLSFGGNYTASSEAQITKDIENTMQLLTEKGISSEDCYFFTPSYEMEVADHRSVVLRDLKNILRITSVIESTLSGRCQLIKGTELMKSSPYFDEKRILLKREPIAGSSDCSGASANDNAHVCGKAAQDMANRVCKLMNGE
jgi:hypothetical protein